MMTPKKEFCLSTIKILYWREIKYLMRDHSLKVIFFMPLIISVIFLVPGGFRRLAFKLNEFHVLIGILLLDKEIYSNHFGNTKEEMRIYLILPFRRLNLIITKNLFSLTFIILQFVITYAVYLILRIFIIGNCANILMYFALSVPLFLGIGNLVSIYSPRGFLEERKKESFISWFIMPTIIFVLSSVPYFIYSHLNLINKSVLRTGVFLLFIILSLGTYYLLLRLSNKMFENKKYYILEKL